MVEGVLEDQRRGQWRSLRLPSIGNIVVLASGCGGWLGTAGPLDPCTCWCPAARRARGGHAGAPAPPARAPAPAGERKRSGGAGEGWCGVHWGISRWAARQLRHRAGVLACSSIQEARGNPGCSIQAQAQAQAAAGAAAAQACTAHLQQLGLRALGVELGKRAAQHVFNLRQGWGRPAWGPAVGQDAMLRANTRAPHAPRRHVPPTYIGAGRATRPSTVQPTQYSRLRQSHEPPQPASGSCTRGGFGAVGLITAFNRNLIKTQSRKIRPALPSGPPPAAG